VRERVRVASVSVVWIGGLEFSKCDGLEDSFGLRCSIFAIKTNKSPNLAPISPRRHQPSAQPVQDLIYALVGFRAALGDEDEDFGAAAAGAGVSSRDSSSLSLPNNPAPSTGFLVEELRFGLARAALRTGFSLVRSLSSSLSNMPLSELELPPRDDSKMPPDSDVDVGADDEPSSLPNRSSLPLSLSLSCVPKRSSAVLFESEVELREVSELRELRVL